MRGSRKPTGNLTLCQSGEIAGLSLLVVVSGSAIGREGAMILAALAASSCPTLHAACEEWKLWIASGAAAGMAGATTDTLAGSLFIAEILFGTLMLASRLVVVSAVVALLKSPLRIKRGGDSLLYTVHLTVDPPRAEHVMIPHRLSRRSVRPIKLMWLMTASHNSSYV